MRSHIERVLFIPDQHWPFADKRACALVAKVAKEWKPKHVFFLGDMLDLFCVSVHDKNPDRLMSVKQEIAPAKQYLDQFQHIPNKTFIFGNHCARYDKYLHQNAPALKGLVDVDGMMGLTKRGYTVVPYMEHAKIGKLHVTHDAGYAGADAHMRAMREFGGNVIHGHTHRIGVHVEGNSKGELHVGAMVGWLGDKRKIDYTHRVKSNKWALGFGTGLLLPNGNVMVEAHPIVNYQFRLDGQVWNG